MIIKFSTATLGRKFNTLGDKQQYKYYPSATINQLVHGFDPIERKIEEEDFEPEYRNIIPSSMEHIRNTYAMQCRIGVDIQKQPEDKNFEHFNTNVERGGCETKDVLYLIVGLSNIFILQFIMVVLLFFCESA